MTTPVCGARLKVCKKCGYRYKGKHQPDSDYDKQACPVCGASRRCQSTILGTGGRCKGHGGGSLKGIASQSYVTGARSKYMPTAILPAYQAALANPALQSHVENIAVLEARLSLVLESVGKGEAGLWWKRLRDLRESLLLAKARGDNGTMSYVLNQLLDAIEAGAADWQQWVEVYEIVELQRKLVDSQRKHEKQDEAFAPLALALVGALGAVIREHVHDEDTRRKLSEGLVRLVTAGAGAGDRAEG